MSGALSDQTKIERLTQLFDKKSNYFYIMLYGSTAFAVLFSLITVFPSLSLEEQIEQLETLYATSNNSSEKAIIEKRIEVLRNELSVIWSKQIEAPISSFTTFSILSRDVLLAFPLIISISQFLYILVLRDLFNLRRKYIYYV